jgi:hypothetical protein
MRKSKHTAQINETISYSDYPDSYRATFFEKASPYVRPEWKDCVYVDIINSCGLATKIRMYFKDEASVFEAHEDACGDST